MKIIFMGTPDFAVSSLDAIAERQDEIVLVISQVDKPRDRGKKLQPTAVKKRAEELGLRVYQPQSIKSEEAFEEIRRLEPELIVVTAYGQIIPKRILDIPKYGCVNVHASLLPKYRGAAPIHYAILNGDDETGITTMYMSEGLDTGDMIRKDVIKIEPSDTTAELHDKLALLSKKNLDADLAGYRKRNSRANPAGRCAGELRFADPKGNEPYRLFAFAAEHYRPDPRDHGLCLFGR